MGDVSGRAVRARKGMADSWITIGTFERAEDAVPYREALEARGIEAHIAPPSARYAEPARLVVESRSAASAGQFVGELWRLRTDHPADAAPGEAAGGDPPFSGESACCCPHCGSHQWFAYWKIGTFQNCLRCKRLFLVPLGLAGPKPALPKEKRLKAVELSSATAVPRVFSIGAMMTMVALFALVLALLGSLDAVPSIYGVVSVLFAAVTLAQPVLFHGRQPRKASVLAGAIVLPIAAAVALTVEWLLRDSYGPPLAAFLVLGVFCIPLGGFLGYCLGTLAAGVFLLMEHLARRRAARIETFTLWEASSSTTTTAAPPKPASFFREGDPATEQPSEESPEALRPQEPQ